MAWLLDPYAPVEFPNLDDQQQGYNLMEWTTRRGFVECYKMDTGESLNLTETQIGRTLTSCHLIMKNSRSIEGEKRFSFKWR